MTRPAFVLHVGDCRAILAGVPAASIDACVTDPPYELGFMGKQWDSSGVAFQPETWAAVLRVMRPGAHLLAFGGTRTHHRMACAIEDAGFEIRDSLQWIYGSGFPKSLDVSKDLDRLAGVERQVVGEKLGLCLPSGPTTHRGFGTGVHTSPEAAMKITAPATPEAALWSGWGTALKPAHEPIILARVPLEEASIARQVLATGTGAINVDGCRLDGIPPSVPQPIFGSPTGHLYRTGEGRNGRMSQASGRWPPNVLIGHPCPPDACLPGCPVLELGDRARFFPVFRYCEKASRSERERGLSRHETQTRNRVNPGGLEHDPRWAPVQRKNVHPTVKPVVLMRWLVRLVTPPGGTVLDPFTGSGTTGMAAMAESANFAGCELSPDYAEIARGRIEWTRDHGDDDENQAEQVDGQGRLFGEAP